MGSYSEIRFMNRSRRSLRIITAFLVLVTPTSSYAWNYTGHRVIASIAYRQLDDQTKPQAFAGQKVKVTGTLDQATKTIHVADIQAGA